MKEVRFGTRMDTYVMSLVSSYDVFVLREALAAISFAVPSLMPDGAGP